MNAEQATEVIAFIAKVSSNIAWQAGVGGMETAGSIISYLAKHPEHVEQFLIDGSVLDWPIGWHEQGCLTWHGTDGNIHDPETARQHRIIKKMEKGE